MFDNLSVLLLSDGKVEPQILQWHKNMFTVSDGIIISSDIPSDMLNMFCRLRNLQLKKVEFRKLKLDGDSCAKETNYVRLLQLNLHFVHKQKVLKSVVGVSWILCIDMVS